MTNSIKRIYVRRYRDSGQVVAYVEWNGGSRSEATLQMFKRPHYAMAGFTFGNWMHMLFARAKRQGLRLEREAW